MFLESDLDRVHMPVQTLTYLYYEVWSKNNAMQESFTKLRCMLYELAPAGSFLAWMSFQYLWYETTLALQSRVSKCYQREPGWRLWVHVT
jgi:hypothetical protein